MLFTIYYLDHGLTITSKAEGTTPHEAFEHAQRGKYTARGTNANGLYMIYPTDNRGDEAHHRMSAVIQVVETPAPIHAAIDMVERVEPPRRLRRRKGWF